MPPKKKAPESHLLIIDGHAMAYRAHFAFAAQNLSDAQGNPVETIFGFFRMFIKLLLDRRPTHLVVCFDPSREKNPRYEIYPEYKANRAPMADTLREQLETIQSMVTEIGITPFIVEGAEADDAIASLIEQHRSEFSKIDIVSGDKDLYSMLYPNVIMLRSKKGVSEFLEIDEPYIKKEIGISREQVADYMALVGDTSDNVPGVKGIGEKTAAKLMADFKSLERIYQNIEKVTPAGVQAKLKDGKASADLSLKLVTLRKDLPLDRSIDAFTLSLPANLSDYFKSRGYPSLANEAGKLKQLASASKLTTLTTESPRESKYEFCKHHQCITRVSDAEKLVQTLSSLPEFAFDTETTGLSVRDDKLVGMSFAWRVGDHIHSAYLVSSFDDQHDYHFDYASVDSATKLLAVIRPLLENSTIKKIGQNIKFDLQVMRTAGVQVKGYSDDTMLMSYLINPNVRRHGMDDLAEDYLGYKTMTFDELCGKGKSRVPLVSLPLEKLAFYACEDAEVTLALRDRLLTDLESRNLVDLYRMLDLPLAEVIAEMEYDGIAVDVKYLETLSKSYHREVEKAEKLAYELAGENFNIGSPKQLQTILFDKLKIASGKKTQKGQLSTDQSVLEELRGTHLIVDAILNYRHYSKLLGTYVDALPHDVSHLTRRIHTSFSQVTAATGRLSSLDPNLQNIPIKGEDGQALRRAFIAESGNVFLSLDYSQIELRILAHYCEDKNLIAAYQADEDIHDRAAYMLFRSRFNAQSKKFDGTDKDVVFEIDNAILTQMKATAEFADLRSKAKILNFSIVYGVTEFGLSRNLSITRAEAKELIQLYFTAFPGIRTYMDHAIESAREKGYAENLFGRRRALAEINSGNHFAREAASRLAINTPIQSTAADLIKKAMIEIAREIKQQGLQSKMLLQIHDELLFEVKENEKQKIEKLARHQMESVLKLKVPLKVSGKFGANWDECKG